MPTPDGDGITDVHYLFDYYPEIGNTKMANEHPDVDFVSHENGVPVILDYYLEQTYNDGNYDLDDFMQRLMGVVES